MNPAFIYFVSCLFEKDDSGSSFIKMVFMVFGILMPLAVTVLQMVDEHTKAVADTMRWPFYVIPIFSLIYGYISIANRGLLQLAA